MFGILGTIIGIIFILFGAFLVIIMPLSDTHQSEQFALTGIILGFIFLLGGVILIVF